MDIVPFIWIGGVLLASIKLFFDQFRFLQLYRKELNPPYPIVPGESPDLKDDPFGLKIGMRWLKISFSKHSKYPNLAKAARRVRLDLLVAILIGVGGFLLIAATIFL